MESMVILHELEDLLHGDNKNPHNLLGIHLIKGTERNGVIIRVYIPDSPAVFVINEKSGTRLQMNKSEHDGFYELLFDNTEDFFTYKLEIQTNSGHCYEVYDPYSFLPTVSEYDTYLFNQGNHHKAYEFLGAHQRTINGISGVSFSVWAPSAKRVSVVGSFNQWDGRRHTMRLLGSSGVWEIFVPGITNGDIYKYEIKTPSNELYLKADPYAFYAEKPPLTASIVYDHTDYQWADSSWLEKRKMSDLHNSPVSIYEVHLSSWKQVPDETSETGYGPLSYRDLADQLVSYAKEMGYTHLELLPLTEHPYDGSWGYQVTGYYAATSRYGTPDDLRYFIDKCHQNNLGVILDWVPAHFPKDGHGLARFDGTALYEHEDERKGEHLDWGTHIFNYGRHEVRNFLISNAIFWFERFHIDGIRVDAVASMIYLDYARKDGSWIPNEYGGRENIEAIEFIKQLNETIHKYFPGVMITAEESTSWPMITKPPSSGGLGFTHKWNMGWMNDFLRYMSMDSIYRKYNHNLITFSMMYAWSENYILVLSHDEVVHGKCSMLSKMPGDYWQKFAGLRAAYGFFYGHPGKKLLFMGGEFGQFIEWKYKESLDWHLLDYPMHKKMHDYVRDLNKLYISEPSLHQVDCHHDGFEWIDCDDKEHSVISFIRKAKDWRDMLIFVLNFTPISHHNYRIGAPVQGFYKEIFNSDAEIYGGSNIGNMGGVEAETKPFHNKPYSMTIGIPPLSVLVFKPMIPNDKGM